VFNFRSEGRSFASSNRCVIPASAFEGVGSATQSAALRRMRCDAAQGLIAPVLEPVAVAPFLQRHRRGLDTIAPARLAGA
jgi:hypothetical protein